MTPSTRLTALASSTLFFALVLPAQTSQSAANRGAEQVGDSAAAPVIACTLSSKEKRERVQAAENDLLEGVSRVEELDDGYVLWFPSEDGRLQKVAEFVQLESQCCAFLDFEIRVPAGGEELALSLTGPEGTKEVLAAMLAE